MRSKRMGKATVAANSIIVTGGITLDTVPPDSGNINTGKNDSGTFDDVATCGDSNYWVIEETGAGIEVEFTFAVGNGKGKKVKLNGKAEVKQNYTVQGYNGSTWVDINDIEVDIVDGTYTVTIGPEYTVDGQVGIRIYRQTGVNVKLSIECVYLLATPDTTTPFARILESGVIERILEDGSTVRIIESGTGDLPTFTIAFDSDTESWSQFNCNMIWEADYGGSLRAIPGATSTWRWVGSPSGNSLVTQYSVGTGNLYIEKIEIDWIMSYTSTPATWRLKFAVIEQGDAEHIVLEGDTISNFSWNTPYTHRLTPVSPIYARTGQTCLVFNVYRGAYTAVQKVSIKEIRVWGYAV
jgi:hypothetical protein